MSRDQPSIPPAADGSDRVDEIIRQWTTERPEVDVSAMAIVGRINRLDRLIRPLLEEVFAQHGLESWEFDVLATLVRTGAPHELTPGRLLDATMITSGAMTNRLDRLESRGFVHRRKSETDGRQVLVSLTDEGRTVVDAALVDHAANELRILDALDDEERTALADLLRTLARRLEAGDH